MVWGRVAQPGRAPRSQRGGLGFESRRVHFDSIFYLLLLTPHLGQSFAIGHLLHSGIGALHTALP